MTRNRDASLQTHIRRLWRHDGTTLPTPRRGPRQQLDLDDILEAGIAIADLEGLEAVSTRTIAAKFGKSAMALYAYVGTKDYLLALMQDHAFAMPVWDDPATGLGDDLQMWACRLYDVYLAHPWLTKRPWSLAELGPREYDWLERLLQILLNWQVPRAVHRAAIDLLYPCVRAAAARYHDIHTVGVEQCHRRHAGVDTSQTLDACDRYPLSIFFLSSELQRSGDPRSALTEAVRLLTTTLELAP